MSEHFHEVQFPMRLSLGAIGGPERMTDVLSLASGKEIRNARWSRSRRRWDVGGAITDLGSLQDLLSFFEARMGRLYGFRFRDPLDHSSAPAGSEPRFDDQNLGIGDGETRVFQLAKTSNNVARDIQKPVLGSLRIGLGGAPVIEGWSVDYATGEIAFEQAPMAGATLTAGFEFDCPVRFESDQIQAVIEAFGAGRVASVGLTELV